MSQSSIALEVTDLHKSYGALTVTKGVNFQVRQGEALGIIGPNGAGKTTLFNLITGAVRANRGTVHFQNKNVTAMDARSRCHLGISRSFQVPQPFSGLTTFENVLVGAAFGQKISQYHARESARLALERTGLWAKADQKAGTLTLLDRKRLELARAIATRPRLLLLDEIAGGLTDAECRQLIDLIREIKDSGVTIIWIEHVLHALLSVVDRILVLDFGEKIAEGDPDSIMKSPEVSAVYLGLESESDHV